MARNRVIHFRMPESNFYEWHTLCNRKGTYKLYFQSNPDLVTCPACIKKLRKMGLLEALPQVDPETESYLYRLGIQDEYQETLMFEFVMCMMFLGCGLAMLIPEEGIVIPIPFMKGKQMYG